jgi:hypothetical protein
MDATAIIRLALEVISNRLITILALLTSCGLACWVMWGPDWERVTTLAIYVIFSHLTVRTKEKSNAQSQASNSE